MGFAGMVRGEQSLGFYGLSQYTRRDLINVRFRRGFLFRRSRRCNFVLLAGNSIRRWPSGALSYVVHVAILPRLEGRCNRLNFQTDPLPISPLACNPRFVMLEAQRACLPPLPPPR